MEINIILFINLLLYAVLVSQSFAYIIALSNMQKNLSAITYIEVRQLLDRNFRKKYTWVVYMVLLSSTVLSVLCSVQPDCILFITSIIALGALIIDVLLAVKGNMPINAAINNWTSENYPGNWNEYRNKWFSIYTKRQVATIIGFLSLLTGVVFG
ncbi:MAG: hypothetical protein QM737_20900 [Ferruginibacter sp.]